MKHISLAKVMMAGSLAALVMGSASDDAWGFGRSPRTDVDTQNGPGGFCGTPEPVEPCPTGRIATPGPQHRRKVYLNRNGGTFSHADKGNSITNTTPIGTGGFLSPLEATDGEWDNIVSCVQGLFADFNVDIVDIEPTSGDYIEAVVAGSADQIGAGGPPSPQGGILGVADGGGLQFNICALQERGVCFAFARNIEAFYGPMSTQLTQYQTCITIAHEAAHTMGLDHEILDIDVMSYFESDQKRFVDMPVQCADQQVPQHVLDCSCDVEANVQNSHQVLLDYLGPNEQEPPTVTITSPAEGESVNPKSVVAAEASDNYKVARVDLVINGEAVDSDLSPPYELKIPANVAVGGLKFDVVAVDKSYNQGTATRNVTVQPGCTSASDCGAEETCVDQVCLGDIGHGCSSETDCASGLCIPLPGSQFEKFCSQTCTAGSDSCPDGFSCESSAVGGTPKCFASGESGCGCRAGGRDDASAGVTALAAFGLLSMLGWRARRRRG